MSAIAHDPQSIGSTFIELLRWRALHQPDQRAYTFLNDGEQEEQAVTYGQLDAQARSMAITMQKYIDVGERAILLYPPGLDYIAAFLGCMYAGVIAVPIYPPSSQRSLPRIQAVVSDADAQLVLTTNAVLAKMHTWSRQVPELLALKWLATDGEDTLLSPDLWQEYTSAPQNLTFLQYTSGSTGIPKGVMVSHSNLFHNSEMMRRHGQFTEKSVGISWLPMFHDMGLILGVLQPLYTGFPTILMAPAAFIQRPLRWLQAISRYRGTASYAPNFAYELCLKHISPQERSQLDLRSWHLAVNAAEPVRPETIERFIAFFAPCGLPKEAMTPAYGLAEATLMVSCSSIDAQARPITLAKSPLEQGYAVPGTHAESHKTLRNVSCGYVAEDQRVVIANPETMQECPSGEIGEIWVAGPSVTQGYWRRPLETEEIFRAYLKDTHEEPFLRTGDMGFMMDGELFISGRRKDLIILRGRNYYPQDIELVVERSHPSLRPDCGAAFSIEAENEERLVILQEVLRHHEEPKAIIKAIRQAVAEHFEIKVQSIVLLRYGSILKTSSGKIRRNACREAFLNQDLLVIASEHLEEAVPIQDAVDREKQRVFLSQLAGSTPAQRKDLLFTLVTEQIQVVFGALPAEKLLPEQNLLQLGMDSLTAMQLLNRLQTILACSLPNAMISVINEPTINHLIDYLMRALFSHESVPALAVDTSPEMEHISPSTDKSMQFSLLYFASQGAEFSDDKYKLLLEGAKYADQHGFTAVWIPERHFHAFGGLYPNPSVLASALAMVTHRIRLRAGSVVLPLHHPVRVAEEWSVVDNLSSGRVDLAFAMGWNPNDFVLAPTQYETRKDALFAGIKIFQKLWQGASLVLPNGLGQEIANKIYPLPKQTTLTPWVTCTGNPERFVEAGAMGANVLTGLLFQSLEELAAKIEAYRTARAHHGYDPATGHVTLMLHTFVGEDLEEVRQKVQRPFTEYLRSSVDLWQNQWKELKSLSLQNQEQVLSYAFERYFHTHGLFGTPRTCQKMVDRLSAIGVDEIACLIDFGIDVETVIDSLSFLNMLQKRSQRGVGVAL